MFNLTRTSAFYYRLLRFSAAQLTQVTSRITRLETHSIEGPNSRGARAKLFVRLLPILPLLSLYALGQNDGVPTFATIEDHGIDSINLQNLDILINPPIRQKGGAIPLRFSLIGNSGCDYISHTNAGGTTYNEVYCGTTPSKSWTVLYNNSLSENTGLMSASATYLSSTSATCPNHSATTKYSNWVVQDAQGTYHHLPTADYVDAAQCLTASFTDHTIDNSGYTLAVTSGGSAYTVYSVDGMWTAGSYSPTSDPNGNQISRSTFTPYSITDTLATTALTYTPSNGGGAGGTYTWNDINGTQQTISQTYTTHNVFNGFNCTGLQTAFTNGVYFVSGLTYPDGSIAFDYEKSQLNSSYYTGRISTITYKTGGTVTYGYSGGGYGLNCTYKVPPTLTRTTQDGATTYSWAAVNNGNGNYGNTTTVIDPGKNKTVYTFTGLTGNTNAPWPTALALTEVQQYQNTGTVSSPAYTLLTTDVICYNAASSGCATAVVTYPITEKDIYHTVGGMSTSSRTQSTYDGYGNVTSVSRYDFGSSSFTYQTTTVYGSWNGSQCVAVGNNINNRPCDVLITDGTNNLAETRYTYDSHGNVMTTSKWTGSRWLNSSATYNSNGTAATVTDVNNTETTFSYAATGSGGCSGLLLTGTSTVVSTGDTLTTSKTWDSACNGAVPVTSTDTNGNVTHYTYNDPYFRPTSVTDPLTYAKTITYTSPTSVNSHASFGSSVDDVTAYMDGLGRSILAQRQEGPGSSNYDSVSTTYGWNGTVFQGGGSVPCVQTLGLGCSSYFTYSSVDPLGRVLSAQDAGGGTVTYTYTKNDVLQQIGPAPAGENLKSKQFEYDGLGRLTSVCEITSASGSGTCGQSTSQTGFWTRYQYDAIGRLTGVCQNTTVPLGTDCVQSPSTGQQTRRYSYDGLGRVTSETNPESNNLSTSYTYDTDSTCGTSNGDLVKRVDAANNVTCFAYDALHRNTGITYPSGPNSAATLAKTFVYDGATVNNHAMLNAKGHLAEAYTGSKTTDLGFSYDADGRTLDFYESTPHSGGYYDVTASYWANGSLDTLKGVSLPTITYGVDGEGRPSTVSGSTGGNPVSSTSYNSTGQVTDVTFGSGDPVHFGFDPATGRMTQYKLTINGTATYGNLTWNANGTVNQLAITDTFNASDAQTCGYGYDDLARLARVDCGATIWQQNFTYDPFGNITKSVPLGGTGGSFQPGYNEATNRYTDGATYDANGNLINDGTDHVYTWDSDGHPVTLDSDSLVYDALGREVEVLKGGAYTEFVFGPTGKLALMNGQTQTKAFVPLPGGTQVKYAGSSISTYRLPDWLGSFRVGSNPNRTYSWGVAFAPFGEMYAQSGSPAWSFTGEEGTADTVSDEYDFLARKLHSAQGRWISPDPAGLNAVSVTNPQTWNRYAYVSNNPMSLSDPSGLCPSCDDSHVDRFDALGSGDDGCYLTFSCTAFVDELGMQVDSQFAQEALQNGSGASCPQCVVTNVPGAGWAFPSLGGDGSINWAFSFSAEYMGLDGSIRTMNPEWIAEVLGLASTNDVLAQLTLPHPQKWPGDRYMLQHLQLSFKQSSCHAKPATATASLFPPGAASEVNQATIHVSAVLVDSAGTTFTGKPSTGYDRTTWSVPFLPGTDVQVDWTFSGKANNPWYFDFKVSGTQSLDCN